MTKLADFDDEDYMTAAEVAVILKCNKRAVLDRLRAKKLRGTNADGLGWRVRKADLVTYMEALANVSSVRRAS